MNQQSFQPHNADIVLANIKIDNKKQLIECISATLAEKTGISAAGIYTRLMQKENAEGSGIGDGKALPHAKILQLKRPVSMLITLREKIDLDACDNQPVDLVYALLSPRQDGALHLQRLSAATRMLKNKQLCQSLREAEKTEQLETIIQCNNPAMAAAA